MDDRELGDEIDGKELEAYPDVPGEDDQKRIDDLVTSNVKLAYYFANKWSNIPGSDADDVRSQAIHGLVKAANTYKPDQGPFAPYASRVITNYLNHLYHTKVSQSAEITTLDAPLGGDDDSDATMHDREGSDLDSSEVDVSKSEASRIVASEIEKLEPRTREMVTQWLSGKSYRDMQSEFGISFVQVGNIVKSGLAKIKASLADRGITGLKDIWPESVAHYGRLFKDVLTEAIQVNLKK